MGNVLRIFKRDVMRLVKAPAALVVVIALVFLPSLYTWFNVVGFWNPYDNTGNLRVCVVNEDTGAENDLMGSIDVGSQVIDQLHENTQLGWTFMSRDEATDEVMSGKAYAAFIIPANFSENVSSLLTGDFHRPELEYIVNEKAGPVSTKITDTGATTLDQTINATFVSTVSSVVADTLDSELEKAQGNLEASQASLVARFAQASSVVADARATVAGLGEAANNALEQTTQAKASLDQAKSDVANVSEQLQQVASLTVATQNSLGTFATTLTPVLDHASLVASQAVSRTNAAVGTAAGAVSQAQGSVSAAVTNGKAAVEQNARIIEQLKSMQQSLPDDNPGKEALSHAIADLETRNNELAQALDAASQASASAGGAASSIVGAAQTAADAVQSTLDAAGDYRSTLATATLPAVNSGLSQIGGTASGLAGAVSNQTLLVEQAASVLDQLSSTLHSTTDALGQTDALLASLEGSIDTARTDLAALGSSGALAELMDGGTVNASKVAEFMLSPTELQTESLYPLNAYGSAMAPLFTNLTLWIGVFMLMVILRQEVDGEGLRNLTLTQRYLGRGAFLAVIATLQAVVCCTGNLIIGVQAASIPLYYLTAVGASLTYLSIQYALSVTLQHVGKGICVILVFVQIPGATGLYPIEMTPGFFQAVYPFFPFTYGINAMRETIAGFYDGQWAHLMGTLALFFVLFLAIGLLLRPLLTNLNRLFAKQIKESGILNGEDVQAPARRYRTAQLIQALSNREEYRTHLEDHARTFFAWYPHIKHGAWVFGIAVPVMVTAALSLSESEKVVVLTVWLVWLVLIAAFLVVLEFVRDSFERQFSLNTASDEELRGLFSARNRLEDEGDAPTPKKGDAVAASAPTSEEGPATRTLAEGKEHRA